MTRNAAGTALGAVLCLLASPGHAQAPALIPLPASYTAGQGEFRVSAATPIVVDAGDAEALAAARFVADEIRRTRKLDLPVRVGGQAGSGPAIRIHRRAASSGPAESYSLTVTPRGIDITAPDGAGLLYGCATLWELVSADDGSGPALVAAAEIKDAPRFAWRGFMLDTARHFRSPEFIRAMLDWMALHKLNVFHWHLTDDQAWRLEIKKYPRLTDVAAWRVPEGEAPLHDIDPKTGRPRLYGGFYSQEEVKAIVAYAAARHITVVPEIEMPGHATAAIVAYPWLASAPNPPQQVPSDWGIYPWLYNPAKEQTFQFLEDVLTETMALFPSTYIHVGGDEAVKTQWKASPEIQAQMKALGITDPDALQSWFVQRIGRFLTAHGRRLIGWDEILQGGIAPDATVMSWRGIDGAIAAAKTGHDTVMAASPTLYLDNMQSDLPDELPGRTPIITLKDIYTFNPAPPVLTAEQRKHILGVQANLWAEYIRTDERAATRLLPRLAALAEIAWTPDEKRSWPDFAQRATREVARDRALGLAASDGAFAVKIEPSQAERDGTAQVALSNQAQIGDIRFTLDGTAPTAKSRLFAGSFATTLPARLSAATFSGSERVSDVSSVTLDQAALDRRDNHQLKLCSQSIPLNLEDDGPIGGTRARYLIDIENPCWIWSGANLDGVTRITVGVGNLPFNFQIGDARDKIPLPKPETPYGELEVRLDTCDGRRIAMLPLAPAVANTGVTVLAGALEPVGGHHDLCLTFKRPKLEPMWALGWVQLGQRETAAR